MSTAKNLPLPLIVSTPGHAFRTSFQIVFGETGKVYQVPSFRVQAGMTILLSPINGSAVNANPCSIADRASLVNTSSGSVLPAGADVSMGFWSPSPSLASREEGPMGITSKVKKFLGVTPARRRKKRSQSAKKRRSRRTPPRGKSGRFKKKS
jgi:hypothetical protein